MLKRLVLALLPLARAPAPAVSIDCPEPFLDGRGVALRNERLAADGCGLCFSAFALLRSGIATTPGPCPKANFEPKRA